MRSLQSYEFLCLINKEIEQDKKLYVFIELKFIIS